MAHSYFGDAVVCRDFAHAWLKESWATYIEHAWLEDTATMEDTQRAMESRAKTQQHLQDDEILIRHSAAVVDQYVNA